MKTMTALSLVLLLAGSVYAKQFPSSVNYNAPALVVKVTDVFGTFHVHRQGDFATLDWNVNVEGVSSFTIERSYDGEFFDVVDAVAPDESRWNRYTDNTVEPGIIYYRVSALMEDGTVEYSTIEIVKIVKHK